MKRLCDYIVDVKALSRRLEESGEEKTKEEIIQLCMADEKLDACAAYVTIEVEKELEYYDAIIKQAKERKAALEKRTKSFMRYVGDALSELGIATHKGLYTIYKRQNPDSVEVDVPPDKLPEEYREMRIEYKADKRKIKKALEDGENIPGCRLMKGAAVWAIRK